MTTTTTSETPTTEVKTDRTGRPITRRLNYGRGGHAYLLDGVKVPGVTTLLRKGLPKPQFAFADVKKAAQYAVDNLDVLTRMQPEAAIDLVAGEPRRQLNAAGNRGTNIHSYAEQIATGAEVEPPDELVGPVMQLVRFMGDYDVEPLATEFAVVNRSWLYCGSADLMCMLTVDGRRQRALIDYKTGTGVYADHAYQLAAYAWCDTYYEHPSTAEHHVEHPLPLAPGQPPPDHVVQDPETGEYLRMPADESEYDRFDLVAVLWLQDDGYELYPVDAGPGTYREFLYVAQVAQVVERVDERPDTLLYPPLVTPTTGAAE